MQGRHGMQDCQDRGLAWILQNRMQLRQRWHGACDVAVTVAVLPAVAALNSLFKIRFDKEFQANFYYEI